MSETACIRPESTSSIAIRSPTPSRAESPLLRSLIPPEGIDYDPLASASLVEERAQPEGLARMICFSASDEARHVNGAILPVDDLSVDGGATA